MKIRYSHSPGPTFGTASEPSPAAAGNVELRELYKLDALDVHRLPRGRLLLVHRLTRRRSELPDSLRPLLHTFDRFRTYPEHSSAAREILQDSGLDAGAADAIVKDLFRAGVMVSARDWLQRVTPADAADRGSGPWSLVVTTCDRAARLQALLESLRGPLSTVRHPPCDILILDDSRDAAQRSRNRALIDEYLVPVGVDVDYWDRGRRQALAAELARTWPGYAGTIRWLLDPTVLPDSAQTYGQMRNLCNLLTAERRYLTIDDDCLLKPYTRPDCAPGMRVASGSRVEYPYPDAEQLFAGLDVLGVNPLDEHLEVLGQPLHEAFSVRQTDWFSPEWLRQCDPAMLAHLDASATVGATGNGMLGDPGTEDMLSFYAAADQRVGERSGFMEQALSRGSLQRMFYRGSMQPTFTLGGRLISPLLGLDNRHPIPCIPPAGRGVNDAVLGAVYQALYPEAGRLDLPWAIPHRVDAPTPWQRPAPLQEYPQPTPEKVLNDMIQQTATGLTGEHSDARARTLIAHFRGRAQDSDVVLRAYIDDSITRTLALRMDMCEPNRHDSRVQGPMREDLEQYVSNLEAQISVPFVPGPAWLKTFRAACASYAEALEIWPELRHHAAALPGRG